MTDRYNLTELEMSFGVTKEYAVNAKQLHKVLEVKKDVLVWIKERINKYQFEENLNFIVPHSNSEFKSEDSTYRRIGLLVTLNAS